MIRSRYKIPQLVLLFIFCGLFFVLPFALYKNEKPIGLEYLMYTFPLVSLFLIYITFKNAPRIFFDEEFLTVKFPFVSKTYSWSSIKDIYLSKKEYYMANSMEATSIIFDNNDKLLIWQDVYSNCGQMRKLISDRAADKIRDPKTLINSVNFSTITRRRYSGNVYTSFNTLLIIGISMFFTFSISGKMNSEKLFFIPVLFVSFLFLGLGTQMNYFLIDDGCLIIKNHYFVWVNKKVSLQDIIEVDVEQPNKRSAGLRVMTKDFSSKFYGAGSLRGGNWDELLSDLRAIGIPSRNDR